MAHLGNKRKCGKCGAKFYDLGNVAFPCPTCSQLTLAPVRESRLDMDDGPRALVRRPNELRPHQDQIIDHFNLRGRDSQARVGSLREAIIHVVQRSETVSDALEVRVNAPGFGSHKITMSDIHYCMDIHECHPLVGITKDAGAWNLTCTGLLNKKELRHSIW